MENSLLLSFKQIFFSASLTQSRPLDGRAVVALADKTQDLIAEYKTVPKNEGYPDTVPPKAMRRVREPAFLPNMHSRVLLSVDHNQPNAELREFVNANFIRGHNGRPNAYIATQNPTREGVVVRRKLPSDILSFLCALRLLAACISGRQHCAGPTARSHTSTQPTNPHSPTFPFSGLVAHGMGPQGFRHCHGIRPR